MFRKCCDKYNNGEYSDKYMFTIKDNPQYKS